jgi:hypothetical protein
MRIGTTPTHTFTLPADIASTVAKVRVIYSQCDSVVMTKDVTALTGNAVVIKLTQEETLKFHDRKPVDIQLHLLTKSGEALTSDIITKPPFEFLGNEVLT